MWHGSFKYLLGRLCWYVAWILRRLKDASSQILTESGYFHEVNCGVYTRHTSMEKFVIRSSLKCISCSVPQTCMSCSVPQTVQLFFLITVPFPLDKEVLWWNPCRNATTKKSWNAWDQWFCLMGVVEGKVSAKNQSIRKCLSGGHQKP